MRVRIAFDDSAFCWLYCLSGPYGFQVMLSMIGVLVLVRHTAVTRSRSELLEPLSNVQPITAPCGVVNCASSPFFDQTYWWFATRLASSRMYSRTTRPAASYE